MKVDRKSENLNVYDELYNRIIRVFKNGYNVYFSFSGGKDSLVIAQALYELCQQGRINKSLLHVVFIDEEAIYPCVERIVLEWRKRFILLGVVFLWLCMEFKHFNCFNQLQSDESFICWDQLAKNVWVRDMPSFAIRNHEKFKHGMTYQQFMAKINDGIQIVGIRLAESVQRSMSFASTKKDDYIYPIYDFSDNDVWLFIKQKRIDFPDAYVYMWKCGVQKKQLRISQFFSIDTARSLVSMLEFYPGLYERIIAREPNAYLAMFYWDSEMFRRSSATRRKTENKKDYKKLFFDVFRNYEDKSRIEYKNIRRIITKYSANIPYIPQNLYKRMYGVLVSGDPKRRTIRAIQMEIGRSQK